MENDWLIDWLMENAWLIDRLIEVAKLKLKFLHIPCTILVDKTSILINFKQNEAFDLGMCHTMSK